MVCHQCSPGQSPGADPIYGGSGAVRGWAQGYRGEHPNGCLCLLIMSAHIYHIYHRPISHNHYLIRCDMRHWAGLSFYSQSQLACHCGLNLGSAFSPSAWHCSMEPICWRQGW